MRRPVYLLFVSDRDVLQPLTGGEKRDRPRRYGDSFLGVRIPTDPCGAFLHLERPEAGKLDTVPVRQLEHDIGEQGINHIFDSRTAVRRVGAYLRDDPVLSYCNLVAH